MYGSGCWWSDRTDFHLAHSRGGSRGRVQGVCTPPPEMTCGFLIQLVFCPKKKMWFIGVEVEQETSAPPPKKILDPPLHSRIKLHSNCSFYVYWLCCCYHTERFILFLFWNLQYLIYTYLLGHRSAGHCNSSQTKTKRVGNPQQLED